MRKKLIIFPLLIISVVFSGCVVRDNHFLVPDETEIEVPAITSAEASPEIAVATIGNVTTDETAPEPVASEAASTPSPTLSWLDLYEPVLANYRAIADADLSDINFDSSIDTYGVLGSWDLTTWQNVSYGYKLQDLDQNGIPEMIIGNMATADDNYIYSLFTLVDGHPQMVLFSMARDYYCLSSEGGLYHHGSGGAMLSDSMICSYSGTTIIPLYGFFTSDSIDTGGYDFGFYKVTNGDRYSGNVVKINQEDFSQSSAMLQETILPLDDLSSIWIF